MGGAPRIEVTSPVLVIRRSRVGGSIGAIDRLQNALRALRWIGAGKLNSRLFNLSAIVNRTSAKTVWKATIMGQVYHPKATQKTRLIDLVEEAGLDVTDWGNFARGDKWAAANPKYCYE